MSGGPGCRGVLQGPCQRPATARLSPSLAAPALHALHALQPSRALVRSCARAHTRARACAHTRVRARHARSSCPLRPRGSERAAARRRAPSRRRAGTKPEFLRENPANCRARHASGRARPACRTCRARGPPPADQPPQAARSRFRAARRPWNGACSTVPCDRLTSIATDASSERRTGIPVEDRLGIERASASRTDPTRDRPLSRSGSSDHFLSPLPARDVRGRSVARRIRARSVRRAACTALVRTQRRVGTAVADAVQRQSPPP